MPTGYTYRIEKDDGITFAEFARDCARAFGAAIHQRDDPLSAGLTLPTIELYHQNALKDAKKSLALKLKMSDPEWQVLAHQKNVAAIDSWKESDANRVDKVARYDGMMGCVLSWEPPTAEHEGMKKFMIEQLTISCDDYDRKVRDKPAEMTGPKLKEMMIEMDTKSVSYHEQAWKGSICRSMRVDCCFE